MSESAHVGELWVHDTIEQCTFAGLAIYQRCPNQKFEVVDLKDVNKEDRIDEKREQVYSEAARLFNLQGCRNTTLAQIAESLDLTPTAIYNYTADKNSLVASVYSRSLNRQIAWIRTSRIESARYSDAITGFVTRIFNSWIAAVKGGKSTLALRMELIALTNKDQARLEDLRNVLVDEITTVLTRARDSGETELSSPKSCSLALLASLDWMGNALQDKTATAIEAAREQFLEILIDGLLPAHAIFPLTPFTYKPRREGDFFGYDRSETESVQFNNFIKSATRLFNDSGFKGTSITSVAQSLGVTKGSFYHHVKNKDELLLACFDRCLTLMRSIQSEATTQPGSFAEQLEYCCRMFFYVQHSKIGPLIRHSLVAELPETARETVNSKTRMTAFQFDSFLRNGTLDGSIKELDSGLVGQMLAGAIYGASSQHPTDDESLETQSEHWFELFFNGLTPRNPS